MGSVHPSITKRLEIASLLAGLVGIFFTWNGFFLPWGAVDFGEVIVALNGFYGTSLLAGNSITMNILFIFSLLAVGPCYVYLLFMQRNSKGASLLVTAGGAFIMLQTLLWMLGLSFVPGTSNAYPTVYRMSIGVETTLMGCLFIILAGVFSLWRIKLLPEHVIMASEKMKFGTYVVKRFLIFVLTLIGLSLFIFWLYYMTHTFVSI